MTTTSVSQFGKPAFRDLTPAEAACVTAGYVEMIDFRLGSLIGVSHNPSPSYWESCSWYYNSYTTWQEYDDVTHQAVGDPYETWDAYTDFVNVYNCHGGGK